MTVDVAEATRQVEYVAGACHRVAEAWHCVADACHRVDDGAGRVQGVADAERCSQKVAAPVDVLEEVLRACGVTTA